MAKRPINFLTGKPLPTKKQYAKRGKNALARLRKASGIKKK